MSPLQTLLLWPAATRSVAAIVVGAVILLGTLLVARPWLASWRRERRAQAAADETEWRATDGDVAGTIDPAWPILARRTTDLTRYELRQHGVEVGRLDPPQPLVGAAADASANDGAWRFVIRKDGWTWQAVA